MRREVDGYRVQVIDVEWWLDRISFIIKVGNQAPVPGVVFTRYDPATIGESTLRHEMTHHRQQIECGLLGAVLGGFLAIMGALTLTVPWWALLTWPLAGLVLFYPLYAVFWLAEVATGTKADAAYRVNPFEEEAHDNADVRGYLKIRRAFSWVPYLGSEGGL